MQQIEQDNYEQDLAEHLSIKLALAIHYSAFNLGYFRKIMHAQLAGLVILPHGLGLDKAGYQELRKA
ncbi:MAG: hypothetical protein OQK77_07480, partial [Psychromonas sp.]|nr:hypothetical protein [Psychromonas sp.]